MHYLLDPVVTKGYQFVARFTSATSMMGPSPTTSCATLLGLYTASGFDSPSGGDFAFSRDLAKFYTEHDVWETDVARFGIDIWMTTNAITQGFRICQSNLGVKIHDPKDPGENVPPMGGLTPRGLSPLPHFANPLSRPPTRRGRTILPQKTKQTVLLPFRAN